jgi:hypothetical protein
VYCSNGRADPLESDVDCGSAVCERGCANGRKCGSKWDCASRACWSGMCVPALPL